MAKKGRPKIRTRRIYYGPDNDPQALWFDAVVTNAKQSVTINGRDLHALRSRAGTTLGCTLSLAAQDPNNKSAFPHKVMLAAVTRWCLFIVTEINGRKAKAVRYVHSYSELVDLNDTGAIKKLTKDDPGFMDRPLTFHVPPKKNPSPSRAGKKNPQGQIGKSSVFVARGALARAAKAGLIAPGVADQLNR